MTTTAQLIAQVYRAGGSLRIDGDKLKGKGIPDDLLPTVKARRAELFTALAEHAVITCKNCHHRTMMKSCGQPVAAGLAEPGTYPIVWHNNEGRGCIAWQPKPEPPPNDHDEIAAMLARHDRKTPPSSDS